jgi:hypothetical protein
MLANLENFNIKLLDIKTLSGIGTHKVHLGVLIFKIYCFYIILYNFKIDIIRILNFTCMDSIFLKIMINMGGNGI